MLEALLTKVMESEIVKEVAIKDISPLQASMEAIENRSLESLKAENELLAESRYLPENEGLSNEEKTKIKEEVGWPDEIIENIQNMDQYEHFKNAKVREGEINGRKCLIKEDEDIDLNYTDEDGISNRDRMSRGLAPLDKNGKPLELHHLGQKADSPLVELTEEEHRTGEYKDGKKNQSLLHDKTVTTEVHGEGNTWNQERKAHWKARLEQIT